MIEEVDQKVAHWASILLDRVRVDHEPPRPEAAAEGATVHLYLMDLRRVPAVPGHARPPRRLMLRYLVTTTASKPSEAHRMLGELAFAALDSADFELEDAPLPLELWRSFGVPPRPAFVLQVPVDRRPPSRRGPLVEKPLELGVESFSLLRGQVLGPRDLPMAGARVAIPSLGRSTETDNQGRFVFDALSSRVKRLRVEVKGSELELDADPGGEPLLIRWQPMED